MNIKNFSPKDMTILPPEPGTCKECAVAHDPALPHDLNSMHYQMKFQQVHDRAPTWTDAMAHCTEDIKTAWVHALAKYGIEV